MTEELVLRREDYKRMLIVITLGYTQSTIVRMYTKYTI